MASNRHVDERGRWRASRWRFWPPPDPRRPGRLLLTPKTSRPLRGPGSIPRLLLYAEQAWGRIDPIPLPHHPVGPQSTTRSARSSTASGMVRPIALAAPVLMASTKVVGCSTGRSAGLAPFNTLLVSTATCR
jgi:hypothetical protein